MTRYAASLRASHKNVTAVFSPSTGIHTALTDDNFTFIKVNAYDFLELLGNWYFAYSGPIRIIAVKLHHIALTYASILPHSAAPVRIKPLKPIG
jgi:hypothetical protein